MFVTYVKIGMCITTVAKQMARGVGTLLIQCFYETVIKLFESRLWLMKGVYCKPRTTWKTFLGEIQMTRAVIPKWAWCQTVLYVSVPITSTSQCVTTCSRPILIGDAVNLIFSPGLSSTLWTFLIFNKYLKNIFKTIYIFLSMYLWHSSNWYSS